MQRFQARVATVIAVLATVWGCSRASESTPNTTASKAVRIATVAPITGSQAETGQDLVNGIRLAVDEKNAKGGLLGRQIELLVLDDRADPKEAVSVAHRIASDPEIVGIVGHLNSGTTLPASPVYQEAGIPVVMPVPTNPTITKRGRQNLFRIPPTDLDQGTDLAKFALERLGKRRFAIVHDSTDYGQPLATVFREVVEKGGGQVVTFDGVSEGDKDFRPLLTRIKGAKPDALFFAGYYNEGGLIARQARDLGITATLLAADGAFGQQFVDIAGRDAAEGAVMSFIAPDESTSAATKTFAETFRAKYGSVIAFAPLGYDAANVLFLAIERADTTDRKAIIAALRDPAFSYVGVTGESRFDPTGDNTGRRVYFYSVKNGRFVPYTS